MSPQPKRRKPASKTKRPAAKSRKRTGKPKTSRSETVPTKAAEALEWKRDKSDVIRVRIEKDVVPGGLSLAMAPVFVNWQSASPQFGPDDYYILRNVNVANNPVGGIIMLAGLKVFADSVERAEFVTVTWKVARRETPIGHAMIRFIFREDRRPVILNREGEPFANDAGVEDIVLSWEAWRPPRVKFDPIKGLNPTAYALTPRCMLGNVRCLLDSVLKRPWVCYPLKFPEVENAHNELLYVTLALADAVARQTVASILDRRIERGKFFEDYPEPEANEWEQLADHCRAAKVPENPIRRVLEGKTEYQLLKRCCVTMALSSVDWANHRIHRRAGTEGKRLQLAPEAMPALLADLAMGERGTMLTRIPAAIYWLMNNRSALAGKSHEILDQAGLLERKFGRIQKTRYDNRRVTPYGAIADHIIV
jgi:hypothetical protein